MKKVPKNVLKKNFHEHVHKPVGLSEIPPPLVLKIVDCCKAFETTDITIEFHECKKPGEVLPIGIQDCA